MKVNYAEIKKNDIVDGEGVCVSLWTQGCPHRCVGCHNPQTWDFNAGKSDFIVNIVNEICLAIKANGVQRNFSVLGGEPLCKENRLLTSIAIDEVRRQYPSIKIFLWTGYTLEELQKEDSFCIEDILSNIDVLIDGRFELDKRDLNLYLRGSSNQRILYKGKDF